MVDLLVVPAHTEEEHEADDERGADHDDLDHAQPVDELLAGRERLQCGQQQRERDEARAEDAAGWPDARLAPAAGQRTGIALARVLLRRGLAGQFLLGAQPVLALLAGRTALLGAAGKGRAAAGRGRNQ